jgi:hypothetical protein
MDNLVTACQDCNRGKGAMLLPEPQDVVIYADNSVPHPDACHECDELRSYLAVGEEPRGEDHYVAHYRCDHGHEWSTWWQSSLRHTPFGAQCVAAEFNAAQQAYA